MLLWVTLFAYHCIHVIMFPLFSLLPVPPSIVEFPISPGNIVASSNITLSCNVTGFPVPSVDVLRDGVPLLQYDSSLEGELFRFVSITLTDLDFFDTASYSCNATNFLASTETSNSDPSLYTVLCKYIRCSECTCHVLPLATLCSRPSRHYTDPGEHHHQ